MKLYKKISVGIFSLLAVFFSFIASPVFAQTYSTHAAWQDCIDKSAPQLSRPGSWEDCGTDPGGAASVTSGSGVPPTTTGSGVPPTTTGCGVQPTTSGGGVGATLPNPLKNVCNISDLLYLIANIATYIGVILAVLALIWVGFKFVAAQGNSEKINEAKRYFFYIIIGVAILIGASAIISILKNTLTSAGVVQSSTFTNPN